MQHRSVRGTIRYVSKKPESFNQLRGLERFFLTEHQNGAVTIRTISELEIPRPKILRDVISSYDARGAVTDCHLRVSVADTLMGTAWYFVDGDDLEMHSYSPETGRQMQRAAYPGGTEGFGTHPVFNDGYLFKALNVARGPHKRQVSLYFVSPDHRGATPPVIAPISVWMEYVGDETVTVSAGTFETRHFRYIDEGGPGASERHPDIDVWVTADRDYVYVKGEIGGYFMSSYELIDYALIDSD